MCKDIGIKGAYNKDRRWLNAAVAKYKREMKMMTEQASYHQDVINLTLLQSMVDPIQPPSRS